VFLAHPQINVNPNTYGGYTPLLLACSSGKVEVVKILLGDSRVDINRANNDG
jgi:ankyrin repeat protein